MIGQVVTLDTAGSGQKTKHRRPKGPLAEVYRRLVRIHASAAEATNDDQAIRPWVVHELMDVLHYIESAAEEDRATPEPADRP